MKKGCALLFLIGLFVIGIASHARSDDLFWTGSLYNGNTGTFVEKIRTLDWSYSGSGLAAGFAPLGTLYPPGTPFTFLYQSYLAGITTPNGNLIPFPGLNQDFEYTVVAQVQESIYTTVSNGPLVTSLFQTTGGNFHIYYDDTPNRNVSSGFGFDDGTLVASGTIPAGQISSSFSFNTFNKTGSGNKIISGSTDYVNTDFLKDTSGLEIIGFRFEGLVNYPPVDSKTSTFFNGRAGEGFHSTYAATKNDLLLKVEGSGSFAVTPEPLSYVLFIAGGTILIARRLLRKRA